MNSNVPFLVMQYGIWIQIQTFRSDETISMVAVKLSLGYFEWLKILINWKPRGQKPFTHIEIMFGFSIEFRVLFSSTHIPERAWVQQKVCKMFQNYGH